MMILSVAVDLPAVHPGPALDPPLDPVYKLIWRRHYRSLAAGT